MRILLVEDNSDHRELMRLALTEYDATWQVEGVVSGEEVLCHLAEGEAYDVVFLDYSLPGRDGLEVLEEIRRGEAPPPVVMVTGRGNERVAVEAMKVGACDYVVKGEGYLHRLPVVARYAMEANRLVMERKRAEEALEKSTQLLRDTGEMAKIGGWELDLSTKEVSWTEEVGLIHGVEPGYKPKLEEALNFYAPESRPDVEAVVKKTAETGEPYDLETLFIPRGSKDKIWVRSLGRAVYSGGKIVKLTGTFQNIDKYKRAEEALRESEERYRALAESANEAIITIDEHGKIVFFNRAAEPTYGYSADEVLGKVFIFLVPERLRERQWERANHAFSIGDSDAIRKILGGIGLKKDGSEFPVEFSLAKWKINNDLFFSIILRDITERKKANDKIMEYTSKLEVQKLTLEQKNLALTEMIEHIERAKNKIKEDIAINVNETVLPILEKLKIKGASSKYIDLLHRHLEKLASSYGRKLTQKSTKLTYREIEICNIIKSGITTKEVSDLLNVSPQTIERHRKNIRKKLAISNKKVNLTSYLQSL
jgi:PAS domain S-box-containing protein